MLLKFALANPLIFILLAALVSLAIVIVSRITARLIDVLRERLGINAKWLVHSSQDNKQGSEELPSTDTGGEPLKTKEQRPTKEQDEGITFGSQLPKEPPTKEVQESIRGILAYDGVEQIYRKYLEQPVEYAAFEKLQHPLRRLPVLQVLVMQPAFEALAEIASGSDMKIIGVTYRSKGQAAKLYASPGKGDLDLERGPEAWIETVIVSAGRYSSPTVFLLKELIDKLGKDQVELRYQSEGNGDHTNFRPVHGKVVVVICNNDAYCAHKLLREDPVAIAAAPVSADVFRAVKETGGIEPLNYNLQREGREQWPANLLVTTRTNLETDYFRQLVKNAFEQVRKANEQIVSTEFLSKLFDSEPLHLCDPALFGNMLQKLYQELLNMCMFAKAVFMLQEGRDPFDFEFHKKLIYSLVDAEKSGLAKPKLEQQDIMTREFTNTEKPHT